MSEETEREARELAAIARQEGTDWSAADVERVAAALRRRDEALADLANESVSTDVYDALKAQHEAALRDCDHWANDYRELQAALADAQREIERLRRELATCEVERDGATERSHVMLDAKNRWADRAEQAEAQVRALRAEVERLRAVRTLPTYNCDCLPSGPDGRPSDGPDAIYCERDVVLLSDLRAALEATGHE